MPAWLRRTRSKTANGVSRRELGRLASFLLLGGWLPSHKAPAAEPSPAQTVGQDGANLYRSLTVPRQLMSGLTPRNPR